MKILHNRNLPFCENFGIPNNTVEELIRSNGKVADAVKIKVDTTFKESWIWESIKACCSYKWIFKQVFLLFTFCAPSSVTLKLNFLCKIFIPWRCFPRTAEKRKDFSIKSRWSRLQDHRLRLSSSKAFKISFNNEKFLANLFFLVYLALLKL